MRTHILALGSLLLLAGCGSAPPPSCELPDTSPLIIEASDRLNPDASGRSLPTIVRVYQLRDIGALEQASFEELWRDPAGTLGDSLLVQDEVTIYPEQTLRRPLDRNPDANYIVAYGIFRRPVGTTWRTVLPLPAPRSQQQCAARQGDGEAPPPAIPHVTLFAEDFHIEGTLELVDPPSSGGECAAGDFLCAAQQQAADQAPEAPQAPQAPEAPSAEAPAPPAPK